MGKWKIMSKLELCSIEKRIPIKDIIINSISKREFHFFETEGVTNKNNYFTIFQRFKIDYIDAFSNEETINQFMSLVDIKNYYSLNTRGFDVIFIAYQKDCQNFLCFEFNEYIFEKIYQTNCCEKLAKEFLTKYVLVRRNIKPMKVSSYFTCIDKCLRKHGIAYPGNFDGLIFSSTYIPKILVEFSKVNYTSLNNHKRNLEIGRYFAEDKNRWKIFLETANFLKIPNLVIWWDGNNSNNFMTGHIEHINNHNGIFMNEIISQNELISKIDSLL